MHDAADMDSTLAGSRTSMFTASPVASPNVVALIFKEEEVTNPMMMNDDLAFPKPTMRRGQNPS